MLNVSGQRTSTGGTASARSSKPAGEARPPGHLPQDRSPVRTGFTLVEPDRVGLLAIADLVQTGRLRVEIADVLPLADAAKAHQLGEFTRTTGKLVLKVRD